MVFTGGRLPANTKPLGSYQALFIGDGDNFTADAQGFTEPLVVYWESNYTAAQIANGSADSFLKNWATQMGRYKQPIIFDVLDEMNGNWSPYYGNPAEYILAYQRVRNFFSDSNVEFAYDPNVAFSGNPVSSFVAYYPGNAYVDLVGLDGFDFGGQTFAQVFAPSVSAMGADFPLKPLWILSTGSVDNEPAFIQAAFSSGEGRMILVFAIWTFLFLDHIDARHDRSV
jgi:beta-mannanase